MKKLSRERRITLQNWTLVYIIMFALLCFCMLPIIYVINTAFKPLHELFIFPPEFFVKNPTTKNFASAAVGKVDVTFASGEMLA